MHLQQKPVATHLKGMSALSTSVNSLDLEKNLISKALGMKINYERIS